MDRTSVCSQNHVKSTEDTCVLYRRVSRFASVNQPARRHGYVRNADSAATEALWGRNTTSVGKQRPNSI